MARGMLFRGPPLAPLSEAGCSEIERLGIGTIIDLRIESERESKPDAPCAQQLADVTYSVSKSSALAQNKPFDEERAQHMRQAIENQITAEAMPMVLSGMIYDDGIIDPRDTRDVLGIALSAIHSAPVEGTSNFGVFRM